MRYTGEYAMLHTNTARSLKRWPPFLFKLWIRFGVDIRLPGWKLLKPRLRRPTRKAAQARSEGLRQGFRLRNAAHTVFEVLKHSSATPHCDRSIGEAHAVRGGVCGPYLPERLQWGRSIQGIPR
jgi:hypothetical protein